MRSFPWLIVLSVCNVWLCVFAMAQPPASQSPAAQPSPNSPAGSPPPALPPYPLDLVVTTTGDVIVVDRNLPGLWRRQAEQIQVFVQGSKKFRQPLNAARALALDQNGQLLVSDTSTREIYRIDDQGQPQPLTGGAIGMPMDLAVRADGSLMVADLETRALLRVSADGKEIKSVAKVNPRGVFVDHNDKVWVVSQDPQQLQIVADDGSSQIIVDKRTFDFPHQVVVNSKGEAFVSDGYKKAIWKIAGGGVPEVWVSGPPLDNPVGLALVDDQVVVTDPRARQVFRIQDGKCELWFEFKSR
ncbi:MAG: hypothetical protein IT423_05160 [Pirellulaceae bacterium]|nr:hypothetical protein [Pirellulaceae bacterium]